MTPTQITLTGLQPYISFLGTFVQLGGTLLLFALFMLLGRYARRKRYFRTWSNAWGALAIALIAVVVLANVRPSVPDSSWLRGASATRVMEVLYQSAKLSFYGMLVAGTVRYVRAPPGFSAIVTAAAFIVLYAGVSVWLSSGLNGVVVWQAPIAVAALAYAASLMLGLPPVRRSLGSSIAGSFMVFGAVVWAIYFSAFSFAFGDSAGVLRTFVNYNAYLDLLWHLSLGFGMVILLMEDVKHESDAAHAELALAHDNLRRASFYDSVTGSLNRQAYADGVGLEAALAGFGSVIMMDMDDLKHVNDEFGHAAGDDALRHLVDVMRGALRASDKLYRWGGDEFLLIFPGADTAQLSKRLRRILAQAKPVKLADGSELPLRVSLGAVTYTSGDKLKEAIEAADVAMYADKVKRKKNIAQELAQST